MKINETPLTPISGEIHPAGSTTTAPSSDVEAVTAQGNLKGAIDQAMANFDHVLAAAKAPGTSAGNIPTDNKKASESFENYSWQMGAGIATPGAGEGQPDAPGKIHLGDLTNGSSPTTPSEKDTNVQDFSFPIEQVLDVSDTKGGAGAGKVILPDLSGKAPSMADQDPQVHQPRRK